MKAIDCATKLNKENIEGLKASGVQVVGRYLGPESSWKAMNRSEASSILSAGLSLFSIWETNPVRHAYFTGAQGEKDAKSAALFASGIGQPAATPIYFTVDYDVAAHEMDSIIDYFRRIKSVIGKYKTGAYGSFSVVEALARSGAADYYYQTYAWSGGKLSRRAHIYQHDNGRALAGITVDYDRILDPSGTWNRSAAKRAAVPLIEKPPEKSDSDTQAAIVPYPG